MYSIGAGVAIDGTGSTSGLLPFGVIIASRVSKFVFKLNTGLRIIHEGNYRYAQFDR